MDNYYTEIAVLKESYDRNNKDVWKFMADICTDLRVMKDRLSTMYILVDQLKTDLVKLRKEPEKYNLDFGKAP